MAGTVSVAAGLGLVRMKCPAKTPESSTANVRTGMGQLSGSSLRMCQMLMLVAKEFCSSSFHSLQEF
jgi:hypothetical protein